jgi:shikimate kinase
MSVAVRIFLVGFMGAGKSTVGRELARRLEVEFVDLDLEIERRTGRSITGIFDQDGEAEFRRLEHEELAALERYRGVVVATGGGCFAQQANRDRIRELDGTSVWLDVPMTGILERLSDASRRRRPLLGDLPRASELYEARRPLYALAKIHLPLTGREAASDVAQRVVDGLRDE